MSTKSILAYLSDADDQSIANNVAEDRNLTIQVHEGTLDTAVKDAPEWRILPEFILLDVTGVDNIEEKLEQMASKGPDGDTNLILVGDHDSVESYRHYRKLGISEYLVRPITGETLGEAIGDVIRANLAAGSAIDTSRMICVQGVRGGAGASTITSAVARAIVNEHKKRVMLIDLDLAYGTQYLNLGCDQTSGLVGMCENPSRIDALFLNRSVETTEPGLMVLSASRPDGEPEVSAETLKQVIIQAQRAVDMVVVEIPFRMDFARPLIAQSAMTILVTPPTLPGVRETANILSWLSQMSYGGKSVVLMNQVGRSKEGEVARADFTKRITAPATFIEIPYDARAAGRAQVDDQTLYATPRKPIRRPLEELYKLLPTAPAPKGGKGKRGLLGRRK